MFLSGSMVGFKHKNTDRLGGEGEEVLVGIQWGWRVAGGMG
jgi:hypothetical protein